jgi:glycosyltransferase involved in cell wall biosynthesis
LKALFLINAPSGGGAERAIGLVAQELQNSMLEVEVLAINSGKPDPYLSRLNLRSLNRVWKSGVIPLFVTLVKFQRYLKISAPDFVVVNCDLPEFLMAFSRFRGSIILVEHSSMPWHTRKRLGIVVRKLLSRRVTEVVLVSQHLKPWLCEGVPARHISNAILPIKTSEVRLNNSGQIERLVFIGRLVKFQKQPDWLVEISSATGLPVIFMGDGDYRNSLEKLCRDSGIEFAFTGAVKDPWSYFKNGDLLVVPSRFEGSPLVVLEAIKNDVPLILSDIPDLHQFGLHRKHFYKTSTDMIEAIRVQNHKIEFFSPNLDISNLNPAAHNPKFIVQLWLGLFNDLRPNSVSY